MLLSGGLDSSTIAAFASDIPTFTGYYDLPGFDETEYAKMATHGEHFLIKITPDDFIDEFENMVQAIDPFQVGPGVFGQWMVARFVAWMGIKTVFSGEGGDELFGGYARLMKVAGVEMPEGYEDYTLPDDYPNTLKDALDYDWKRLPILMAADEQICEAHGITVTPPMMDDRVVEYAMNLPPERRVGKIELKEAMRGIVPDKIINRKDKKGFPTPYVHWSQEEPVKSFVMDRIGYVPDVNKPYDRRWWYELCKAVK